MNKRSCVVCGVDISTKHKQAKFCDRICRTRHHNARPHRIERTRMVINQKIQKSSSSNLERLLDQKINHPFAGMSEYGDRG